MTYPEGYEWLRDVDGMPQMVSNALILYGTHEAPGAVNNPVILSWAQELGESVANVYKTDAVPWCGLFAGVVAKRSGKTVPKNPLWALSWSAFDTPVDDPCLGDICVFKREGGGHVGIYIAEYPGGYHILGGNQQDQVCITRISKGRFYCAREPEWRNSAPLGRKRYFAKVNGPLSTNEA